MRASPDKRGRFHPKVTPLERRDAPAIVPIGTEFRINNPAISDVAAPAVALDGDGDFVVAWHAQGSDASDLAVLARRYNSSGVPVTDAFQVNIFSSGAQQRPSVACDNAGNFIVVWSSASAQDGSRDGIFARRYSPAGVPLTSEFQINQFTLNIQGSPSVAMDGAGDFVVAWESNYQDGDGYAIYARKYTAAGTPVGNEFAVNVTTTGDQLAPSVAIDSSGSFVVAWQSPDDNGDGVFMRRFGATGTPLSGEVRVNTHTIDQQTRPKIASSATGEFAVVWQSRIQDGGTSGVYMQRFTAAGLPSGTETRVNTYTTGEQWMPSISSNALGELTVTWQSDGQDGDGAGVYCQRFAPGGTPIETEFRVTTSSTGDQMTPAIGADPYGDFVIGWIADLSPVNGVLAQRFAKPPVPHATLTINEGLPQRSAIHSFTLTFNTLVNIGAGGVTLTGPAGSTTLTPDYSASTLPQTTVKYTLSGAGVTAGGLIDGQYTITLNSALVVNYDNDGYDGDGNGLPGPNGQFLFHRLYGDYDGNRRVEPNDFLYFRIAFLSTFGSANWNYAFDSDGNGIIDASDLLQFRLNFLKVI
ncbi:MAG: hypothetical protein K1X57_17750 [Gemmataceae bacterium]|nr:hypothetical protein [Gemmataceae bacterium]